MTQQVQVGNRDTVLRVAQAEAASEGSIGLKAVLAVMRNRAEQTGLTMEQIALQRGQFEPAMTPDGRARMARYRPGSQLWQSADVALNGVLAGDDPTNGADHFYAPRAQRALGRAAPDWDDGSGTDLGNHRFFRRGYRNRDTAGSYDPRDTAGAGEQPAGGDAPAPAPAITLTLAQRQAAANRAVSGGLDLDSIETALDDMEADVRRDGQAIPNRRPERAEWSAVLRGAGRDVASQAEVDTNIASAQGNVVMGSLDAEADRIAEARQFGNQVRSITDELPTTSVMRFIRDIGKTEEHLNTPGWNYTTYMDMYEDGRSVREVRELRTESRSHEDALGIIERQNQLRSNQEALANPSGQAFNLLGQLVDPVSWVATLGTGTALRTFGVGSRMIALNAEGASRNFGIVASLAGEGAIGNMAVTAALDGSGAYMTGQDYANAAIFGGLMGTLAVPFVSREGFRVQRRNEAILNATVHPDVRGAVDEATDALAMDKLTVVTEALRRAGPDAEQAVVNRHIDEVETERVQQIVDNVANPFPEASQVWVPEWNIAPDIRATLEARLGHVADETERAVVAQALHRLELFESINPVEQGRGPLSGAFKRLGLSSAGEIMSQSQYPAMRAIGAIMAEGTTGRSGRRHTVAMEVLLRETEYNRVLNGYDDLKGLWAKENGYSQMRLAQDAVFGKGSIHEQWDVLVSRELRRRERPDLYSPSENKAVVAAADMLSNFYRVAGADQIRWKTTGHEAIDITRNWYFPQELSATKLQALGGAAGTARYRNIISEQARTIFGWDKKFSDRFASKYIGGALERANAGYTSPVRLQHHQAGEFVTELLENLRAAAKTQEDKLFVEDVARRFAKGGASYTKSRLDFDVNHVYKDKDGEYSLADIMNHDQRDLARRYARKAASEVALTKAGVPGRHGVDLLRKVMQEGRDTGKVTDQEMKAFDQLLAEITGTPVGGPSRASAAMDNLRLITSAVKLGGMGITQFAEYGNAIAVIGVRNTLGSIGSFGKMVKDLKAIKAGEKTKNPMLLWLDETMGYEIGTDAYIMDRAFDSGADTLSLYGNSQTGTVSKLARGMSYLQVKYSAQRIVTAVQTRGMADMIQRRAINWIAKGNLSEKQVRILEDMGFNAELRAALSANMDKIAKFDSRGRAIALDVRNGLDAYQTAQMVTAVNRGAHQIIQRTYAGEVGAWAHDDFLKLLLQFRTFSITSVEKQWGRQVRTLGHAGAIAAFVGAASFAAPIHAARQYASSIGMGEEERKEFLARRLAPAAFAQGVVNYVSMTGLFGDTWDILGKMGGGTAEALGVDTPTWLSDTINPRGGTSSTGLIGGSLVPGVGLLNDAYKAMSGQPGKVRNLLPYQAHPLLAIPLNAAETALDDAFDDEGE